MMKKSTRFLIWFLSILCASLIAYMIDWYLDLWNFRNLLTQIQGILPIVISLSTPLWATILMILLCALYTYIKTRKYQTPIEPPNVNEELIEEFGVYWNNQYKPRCKRCKQPLVCASNKFDPSVFFCSNCNKKHSLRDLNGNHLTEAQAIELLTFANHKIQPTENRG